MCSCCDQGTFKLDVLAFATLRKRLCLICGHGQRHHGK